MKCFLNQSMVIFLFLFLVSSCTGVPKGIKPVDNFDLTKYQGKWYEIARLDHSFERGLEQITAQYTIKKDGDVKVNNRGFSPESNKWKQATGNAKFVGNTNTGHLKVSFFGPFYGAYVIFYLDDNYQHAFVSGPDTSYLWLLSRAPKVSSEVLQRFIMLANKKGFNTERLIFVKHNE